MKKNATLKIYSGVYTRYTACVEIFHTNCQYMSTYTKHRLQIFLSALIFKSIGIFLLLSVTIRVLLLRCCVVCVYFEVYLNPVHRFPVCLIVAVESSAWSRRWVSIGDGYSPVLG